MNKYSCSSDKIFSEKYKIIGMSLAIKCMREAVKKNFININKPKILMHFNRKELLCKANYRESSYII